MKTIRLAAALAALALIPAALQAQTTLTACYVPKSGTVYRIKVEGTPTKCAQNHVEFSWETEAAGAVEYEDTTYPLINPLPPGESTVILRPCPDPAERVLSGGFGKSAIEPLLEIVRSSPFVTGQGWEVVVFNHSTEWYQATSFVRCSKPGAAS